MDRLDDIIENVMQKPIYESCGFEQAINTAFTNENITKKYAIKNLIKAIIALITGILITTSAVFAKDISNFISNIFQPQTIGMGVIEMAENGYMENTNMEFIESNGILIKVDNILMDDYNLDIVFEVQTKENIEPIYNIEISDLIISDENNNLIYCNYDRVDLYEEFCKKNNLEFSNKNMHNNFTDGGYQTEVIERTDNSVKFLYKMYSDNYPKSKKLIMNFKNIIIKSNIEEDSQNLKGNWNIEIQLSEEIYNREMVTYTIKDGTDKANNVILEEAKGSYTEMHITLLVKQMGTKFEPTEKGLDDFLMSLNFKDDIIPTLENEKGRIFERSISSSDGNGGCTYHPNGDITLYITFPITKDEYTDTLKLKLTKNDSTINIHLSKK